MKKFLPLFAKVLTLVLFTTLIGCSDDSKDENNSTDKIIGSWVYNGYTGEDGVYHADDTDPCHSFTMTFNSNGKGTQVDKNCDEGDDTWNITWVAKGFANGHNLYDITDDENDTGSIAVTFVENDSKMIVTWGDDTSVTETFTKK